MRRIGRTVSAKNKKEKKRKKKYDVLGGKLRWLKCPQRKRIVYYYFIEFEDYIEKEAISVIISNKIFHRYDVKMFLPYYIFWGVRSLVKQFYCFYHIFSPPLFFLCLLLFFFVFLLFFFLDRSPDYWYFRYSLDILPVTFLPETNINSLAVMMTMTAYRRRPSSLDAFLRAYTHGHVTDSWVSTVLQNMLIRGISCRLSSHEFSINCFGSWHRINFRTAAFSFGRLQSSVSVSIAIVRDKRI